MLRIACPHCGLRDEVEFRYRGDASVRRPGEEADAEAFHVQAFHAYVYERANPAGWHLEWWQHVHGCRQVLKLLRHTVSHEIQAVVARHDEIALPGGSS
ncbi:sarcosine oxidase subunit delta [Labrys neptuniae]